MLRPVTECCAVALTEFIETGRKPRTECGMMLREGVRVHEVSNHACVTAQIARMRKSPAMCGTLAGCAVCMFMI